MIFEIILYILKDLIKTILIMIKKFKNEKNIFKIWIKKFYLCIMKFQFNYSSFFSLKGF